MLNMQAMGKGSDFSSADDTDTDAEDTKFDEGVRNDFEAGAITELLENVYWGDSENDIKMSKTDDKDFHSSNSELDNNYIWKCIRFVIKQI